MLAVPVSMLLSTGFGVAALIAAMRQEWAAAAVGGGVSLWLVLCAILAAVWTRDQG